jgi:hypothetical protein
MYYKILLFYVHMKTLTPKSPRVFQWKNGQNYPLLKKTLVIIFSSTSIAFDHKILEVDFSC